MDHKDLLIADLAHFGESFWRNEEIGEKRFAFFGTLVATGIAALAALGQAGASDVRAFGSPVALALLIIGGLSYLRMLHRNRVSDEYKATLGRIRSLYVANCDGCPQSVRDYRPIGPISKPFLTGGYAETMGVLNGMLVGAWLTLSLEWPFLASVGIGSAVALSLVLYAKSDRK